MQIISLQVAIFPLQWRGAPDRGRGGLPLNLAMVLGAYRLRLLTTPSFEFWRIQNPPLAAGKAQHNAMQLCG